MEKMKYFFELFISQIFEYTFSLSFVIGLYLQKVKRGDPHYPLMFHQADTSKAIIQCKDHESDIQSYPCIIE